MKSLHSTLMTANFSSRCLYPLLLFVALTLHAKEAVEVRIGYFPNITHAQAILAQSTGEYSKKLGVPVKWSMFNAGPSAIEAILVDAIDATYIGPSPAINGHVKTHGEKFRIVSGAAMGGAALVVRPDSNIKSHKDFADKIIATPQLGNTQDVAARSWFKKHGYEFKEKGGNLTLIPLSNPDQFLLFQKKEIDGAWTIEPWVSRLEKEAGGKIFLEEKSLWPDGEYGTAHLIVSTRFLKNNPPLARKLIQAHVEITQTINHDKKSMGPILNREIGRLTGKPLPQEIFDTAWNRVKITWDPITSSLRQSADDAFKIGFFRKQPDLANIHDLSILNEVLKEKSLPPLKTSQNP